MQKTGPEKNITGNINNSAFKDISKVNTKYLIYFNLKPN